jgi:hypothetical protein
MEVQDQTDLDVGKPEIIKKIPRTYRYQLTESGRLLTAALRATREANLKQLLRDAA